MTHSALESLFQQTHSLEWPIHLKVSFTRPIQVGFDIFKKKKLVDSTILSWMGHSSEWAIQVNGSSSVELNSNFNIEDDVWALWNL